MIFDIAGVVLCLFCDLIFPRFSSGALFYVIWFVDGVFCGLFGYDGAGRRASPETKGDWSKEEWAGPTGILVIVMTALVLGALSIPCYYLMWQYHPESSYYVPDSLPHSITFFVTVFASTIFAHTSSRPAPKKTT